MRDGRRGTRASLAPGDVRSSINQPATRSMANTSPEDDRSSTDRSDYGSESSLFSRSESLAESQATKMSSLVATGLKTVGLSALTGPEVVKATGNEDRAPSGMQKKWQRHFVHGKWIQLGIYSSEIAMTVFLLLCIIWSQLLYRHALDSKVMFEAVIDSQDQAASDVTYLKWLEGLHYHEEERLGEHALHSFYVWHVNNPSEVMQQGFKPNLRETGPFGYIKRTTKYDVRFSTDDSRTVTFRSWTYFDPVESEQDCYEMFFRMDKAELRKGIPDCPGDECSCVNDTQKVTVVNPPFLKLMDQFTPVGLISTLSQEAFATIKEGLTMGFVRATKAYLLPSLLADIYRFRKAIHVSTTVLSSILDALVAKNGTSAAVVALQGSYLATEVNCLGLEPSGYTTCPWGLLTFIESAGSALGVNGTITEAEVEHLLGMHSPTNTSIFDQDTGIPLWVSAGRHAGYLVTPSMPLPGEIDPSGEEAFNTLVESMCLWEVASGGLAPTTLECQAKVIGTLEWMYGVWFTEMNMLDAAVLDEWRGVTNNTYTNFTCDAIGTTCSWPLANEMLGQTLNISAGSAKLMVDPSEGDSRNDLSFHTVDGQTLWTRAYTYCIANSSELVCEEASSFVEAATTTLPGYLAAADGFNSTAGMETHYQMQVCAIARQYFGDWVSDSDMLNYATAKRLNTSVFEKTGFEIRGDSIENIGYVQWATGAVTHSLLGLETLSTITQDGVWDFMDEDYHSVGPEIWAQIAISGYSEMKNLSVGAGKVLLDMLAEDSASGDKFRKHVAGQSTTYYGDMDDWWVGSSSTTQSFDSTDVLFIEENINADFSQSDDGGGSDKEELLAWLNTPFMSSAAQCYVLEGYYEACLDLVTPGGWPENCDIFQTILSNTVTGIECDATRIYDNAHPYPKKPGNLLATFMYSLMWEQVLKKEYHVCNDPVNCDFSKGGFFTTQRARDVVFGGYAEGLTIKLLNKNLAPRNLTIQCSQQRILAQDKTCNVVYDGDCTEGGFEVIHAEHGVILQVNKSGPGQHLWYAAELSLPHDLGVIDNPVFAVFPGANWANETFQQNRYFIRELLQIDVNFRMYSSTKYHAHHWVNTGRADAETMGSVVEYYGNATLFAEPGGDSVMEVYGSDGTQCKPYKWEGFDAYSLVYRLRDRGLHYLGNETVVVLEGENLMQFHMTRDSSSVVLRYPTIYTADDNSTATISVRLNRYVAQTQDWLDARQRIGDGILVDFNGMPYAVPEGMASTQVLTGYGTFTSDPHFYTNNLLNADASAQVKNMDPVAAYHQSHVDVDPVTGKVLRRAIRLQINLRMERNAFSPDLLSSASSATVCRSPTKDTFTNGYGCFMYLPILWYDDERVMDEDSLLRVNEEFLDYPDYALETATYGLIGTLVLAFLGSVLWIAFVVLRRKFNRKCFVD